MSDSKTPAQQVGATSLIQGLGAPAGKPNTSDFDALLQQQPDKTQELDAFEQMLGGVDGGFRPQTGPPG